MARRITADTINDRPKSEGGAWSHEIDIKLKKDETIKKVTIRLLGIYIGFYEHSNWVDETPGKQNDSGKQSDFPDKDLNRSFKRRCTCENVVDYGPCVWCEMKYRRSQQYAQNVLLRTTDEAGESKTEVKILKAGAMIFDAVAEEERRQWRYIKDELGGKPVDEDGKSVWTHLGGAFAPDITLTIERDPSNKFTKQKVTCDPRKKAKKLGAEEIAAIESVRKATDKDIEDNLDYIKVAYKDPMVAAWGEKAFAPICFGSYDLFEVYKPDPLRCAAKSDGVETLEVDDADPDADDDDAPAKTKKSKKSVDDDDDDDDIIDSAPAKTKTKSSKKSDDDDDDDLDLAKDEEEDWANF